MWRNRLYVETKEIGISKNWKHCQRKKNKKMNGEKKSMLTSRIKIPI